jgi:hypothetical protein
VSGEPMNSGKLNKHLLMVDHVLVAPCATRFTYHGCRFTSRQTRRTGRRLSSERGAVRTGRQVSAKTAMLPSGPVWPPVSLLLGDDRHKDFHQRGKLFDFITDSFPIGIIH